MNQKGKDLLIGLFMGCTMSVPGVSGGTMAVAFGYYSPILSAAGNFKKRENIFFLLRLFAGGVSGFLLGAKALTYTLKILPLTVTMLFCGAVLAGIWILGKQTFSTGCSLNGILFFMLGIICVFSVEKIPPSTLTASPLLMLLWGFFLALGLILPGISTSHLLTVFGLYETVTDLSGENILRILPLFIGILAGIFLMTKPLAKVMDRFPHYCNCVLLGFCAGSLKGLIESCLQSPKIHYLTVFQIINGLILGAGAAAGILMLHRKEEKVKKL